jgi:hypothetical protein
LKKDGANELRARHFRAQTYVIRPCEGERGVHMHQHRIPARNFCRPQLLLMNFHNSYGDPCLACLPLPKPQPYRRTPDLLYFSEQSHKQQQPTAPRAFSFVFVLLSSIFFFLQYLSTREPRGPSPFTLFRSLARAACLLFPF